MKIVLFAMIWKVLFPCVAESGGLFFDGVTTQQSVNLVGTASTPMNIDQSSFTIEVWIKPKFKQTQFGTIFSNKIAGYTQPGFFFFYNWWSTTNGQLGFESAGQFAGTLVPIVYDVWQHVALTYSICTGAVSFYIDGIKVPSNGGSANVVASSFDFMIGNFENFGAAQYFGDMDESRFWNYARSSQQIQSFKDCEVDPATSGLLAYYNFDQVGDPTTLEDTSGNGYDGTLVNFADPARAYVPGASAIDGISCPVDPYVPLPAGTCTASPTKSPTDNPTSSPTAPTISPTSTPTTGPTSYPTKSPTMSPTTTPTSSPTIGPTMAPSSFPTSSPSDSPTITPTKSPTATPTTSPTNRPTLAPSSFPTSSPSNSPTKAPTKSPTTTPTNPPTSSPSKGPTSSPTLTPTSSPTRIPTKTPTSFPTTPPPTASPTTSPATSLAAEPMGRCVFSLEVLGETDCAEDMSKSDCDDHGRISKWTESSSCRTPRYMDCPPQRRWRSRREALLCIAISMYVPCQCRD